MKQTKLFYPLVLLAMTSLMPQTAWALTQDTDGNNTIDQYTITVTSADENMGTVTGGGTYDNNSQQTITATPKEHYHFVKWNDDNTDNPRTITVTGEATYTATFAIDQHTITVTSDNEEMGTVTGGGTYDYNSQITITATHQTGYHFVSWNDGNTDASRQITVTEAATYTATFAIDQFRLTFKTSDVNKGLVSYNETGSGVESHGTGYLPYGSDYYMYAIPKTGYHFVKWSDGVNDYTDGEGDENTAYCDFDNETGVGHLAVHVTEDKTYTAYFAPNKYIVTVGHNYSEELGEAYISGTANEDETYDYGTTITLCGPEVSGANAGYYHFIKWEDEDGNLISSNRVHDVTVTGDMNYSATYEYVYNITGNTLTGVASWAEGALEIPSGVVTISADAFNGCAVTAVTIPATVTTIAEHAFNGCNSLTDITFAPESKCKSIGENAVYNTTANTSLHLTSLPKIGSQSCLTVASLALTDESYVSTVDGEFSYVTFPGKGTRTYTRQMTNEWGTAVLPFTVETNSEVQLYSIVSLSCPIDGNEEEETEPAGTITLSAVSDTIQANRPFVFRKKNPNATSVTFTDSKNLRTFIPHDVENSFTIAEVGVKLVGTFIENYLDACQVEGEETECTSTNYFIANNAFWRADDGVTIPPFRAWFDFSEYNECGQDAPARFIIAEANDNNPPIATGLSGTDSSTSKGESERGSKVLINGQLLYLREGKMYNINGQVIK